MSNPQEQSPRATGPQLSKEEQTGHTPGPWKVGNTTNAGGIRIISADAWCWDIATVDGDLGEGDYPCPESRANAELIARAPELASSLSRVEGERDELKRENQRLREALEETERCITVAGSVERNSVMHDDIKAALSQSTTPLKRRKRNESTE